MNLVCWSLWKRISREVISDQYASKQVYSKLIFTCIPVSLILRVGNRVFLICAIVYKF